MDCDADEKIAKLYNEWNTINKQHDREEDLRYERNEAQLSILSAQQHAAIRKADVDNANIKYAIEHKYEQLMWC